MIALLVLCYPIIGIMLAGFYAETFPDDEEQGPYVLGYLFVWPLMVAYRLGKFVGELC
jgi:hypothetical protein